jgi:hypothetical protein
MIDSTTCAALMPAQNTPDAVIALVQASPRLNVGRSHRPSRPVLRPASTHAVEPTI